MERTRLKIEVVGPYTGPRISGSSVDVLEARFTVSYAFDDITVVVENIPGRWGRGNDRELVSGKVASQVQARVNEVRSTRQQTRNESPYYIDASRLLAA